jgi:ABC-type polysaccharide/polyol phosphate export permease
MQASFTRFTFSVKYSRLLRSSPSSWKLGINFIILAGLLACYLMEPTIYVLWVPLIIGYTMLGALSITLAGGDECILLRRGDISASVLSLLMYASPVIYPLALVNENWCLNPLTIVNKCM